MGETLDKPLKLYIYDDIDDLLPVLSSPEYSQIMRGLVTMLRKAIQANENTLLIGRDYAVDKIKASYSHKPFDIAFAIGSSGYLVAKRLHFETNWFPNISLLPIKRNEVQENEYVIYSRFKNKISHAIRKKVSSIAIIDDTLYSGLTVRTVLENIPDRFVPQINLFFLHALEDGLASIANIQSVNAGLFIPGKREIDVSIIRASGLFYKGAIRRLKKSSQAFYQRPQWMQRWFPVNFQEIISISRKISFLLELHKRSVNTPGFDYSRFLGVYKPFIELEN